MMIVGLALAPLALASIIQAVLNFRAYQRETDRVLVQTALYAAYSEQNIFARAEQLLRSLARHPELTAEPASCHQALADALVGAMPIVNFTRLNATGQVICMGAVVPPRPFHVRLPWWPNLRASNGVVVGNQFISPVLKRSLLPIALPLHDAAGRIIGALSASVDLHWLETAPQVTKLPRGALSMIVDTDGHVLASNHPTGDDLPKVVVNHAKAAKKQVFTVDTDAGRRWRWVAEPIGVSDKYVAFGIPEPRLFGTFRGYLLADVLLTLLIVAATCAAIWLGTEWVVIRWTLYLKRVAVAFGRNHLSLSLADMRKAPEEFQQLGRQMKRMASAIQERDRNLNQALEHQLAMTREIHHRVKNNLQIVSSLIFMYAQTISDPMARGAFGQIITRMDALTLIQRLIERADTDPRIDMHILFEDLAEQVRVLAAESGQTYDLALAVEQCWLSPDIATPIVLFAIEALTYDLVSGRARQRNARLEFSCRDDSCILLVEDHPVDARPGADSLSDRIMRSLADQLRGQYSKQISPNGDSRILLRMAPGCGTGSDPAPQTDALAFGTPLHVSPDFPGAQPF